MRRAHCHTLPHTATHCHTHCRTQPRALPHTAALLHCRTVAHYCCSATHALPHTAAHCRTLPHTTTHCRTLLHCQTAAHCHVHCHTHNTKNTASHCSVHRHPLPLTLLALPYCCVLRHKFFPFILFHLISYKEFIRNNSRLDFLIYDLHKFILPPERSNISNPHFVFFSTQK
jgi:hypothetical protein